MSEISNSIRMLEIRLGKLERRKQRLKLYGILIVMLVLMGGFGVVPNGVITAGKIVLVDKSGIPRLRMDLDEGTPRITFTYENGDPCLLISGRELCYYDQGKKVRINMTARNSLDLSSLSILDKEGKNCVTLSATPEGPYLSLEDHDEKKEVILSIDPIGTLNSLESMVSGKP